jgi:PTS system mannose-specific IIA component
MCLCATASASEVTTGVIILTHNRIGEELLRTAENIIGKSLPRVVNICIPGDIKPAELGFYADQVKSSIDELDNGDGVLILTDMHGATPSNLAHYFAADHQVKIVSGINLPMLIRVINYAEQPLELLAKIGIVGANKGITNEQDL